VNQMWILKNSKDLLEYIQSKSLSSCNNTKTFDFSTLYTTIPLSKLKNKIRDLVQLCFIKKNDQRRYKYLLLGSDRSYVVKHHCDSTKKFSVTDIFNMLECLIDNIFAMFGGRVFQQTVDIPMGTICAPLVTDLFLYSYEADFIQGPLKKSENKLARSFNFIFRYIDDVLSLNNSRYGKFTMGKLKSSFLLYGFVLNLPSLSISRCRSRYEADLFVSGVFFISSSMG
jgi:hypothetical protein